MEYCRTVRTCRECHSLCDLKMPGFVHPEEKIDESFIENCYNLPTLYHAKVEEEQARVGFIGIGFDYYDDDWN